MNTELGIFLVQLTICGAICVYADRIGSAFGLMDDPRSKVHGLHASVTPLVGGLAVLCPWFMAVSAYPFAVPELYGHEIYGLLSPMLVGFTATLLVLGALDDRYQLSAKSRLWFKIASFSGLVVFEDIFQIKVLNFPGLGIHVPLGFASIFFTILCLTALTNAVNMCDGRNGLVIGMVLIWLCSLIFYQPALRHPLIFSLVLALLIVGWFNLRGLLFLGDAGSYALSCLVGLMAIWAHNHPPASDGLSTSQLASLFLIPALDMFRLMVVRTMRGSSFMSADHDHLHHRIDRYCGWKFGLPLYLSIVALPILLAFSTAKSGFIGMAIGTALYFVAWAVTKHSEQLSGEQPAS